MGYPMVRSGGVCLVNFRAKIKVLGGGVENISLYIDFPLLEFAHLSLFLREER